MKQHCLTLINYLKPMKKLSKYLLVVLIFAVYQSCIEPKAYYRYYEIKNETGQDVFIKFYYSVPTDIRHYDSFKLKNNESSDEFYEMSYGGKDMNLFIYDTDSIDIYINNNLVKRYKLLYSNNQTPPKKSLYYEFNYDTVVKSEKGHDVRVYKILMSDFE